MRVAIVGAGPKGLFAAERLVAHLGDARASADITLFDPQPPGWGSGYRPDQPDWLRLNVNAAIVSADGGGDGRPSLGLIGFAEWHRARGEVDALDPFPPRALVGSYLNDAWQELLTRLPQGVMLRHEARRVGSLIPSGETWLVNGEPYHQVLLCTGHAEDWPGALRHTWSGNAATGTDEREPDAPDGGSRGDLSESRGCRAQRPDERTSLGLGAHPDQPSLGRLSRKGPDGRSSGRPGEPSLVPRVYPVQRWLGTDRVPPGSTVVCRGAALTFIDAALTLTEGRGGRFTPDGYRPSGAEPSRILPVGRRGAFPAVKPAPDGPLAALHLRRHRDRGLTRCAAAADVPTLLEAVWRTAADYLLAATGQPLDLPPGTVPTGIGDSPLSVHGAGSGVGAGPVAALRRSVGVATGQQQPGAEWALGQAWRDLYPAIVEVVGHQRTGPDGWHRFARVAAAMEPVAFGPPPVNAGKLSALCEAGVVDAAFLAGRWSEALGMADVVVDCVLAPPGLVAGQWPDDLVGRGLVPAAGRRGVAVAPDASCLDAEGVAIGGLSALGRLTEDVVVGNDTLSRTLHSGADLWARRVAVAAASMAVTR